VVVSFANLNLYGRIDIFWPNLQFLLTVANAVIGSKVAAYYGLELKGYLMPTYSSPANKR